MESTPTVLVVEDDLISQRLLARACTARGYRVVVVGTAAQAEETFAADTVDMLLLDRMLPDGDGLDLCQRFRGTPQGSTIVVMVVTSLGDPAEQERALEAGADDFLVKPVDLRLLAIRLAVLERRLRELRTYHATLVALEESLTEQRRSEEALRFSEQRIALALQATHEGLWDWDFTTGDVYFSPHWKKLLGYEEQEIPNRFDEWTRRVHPDDLPVAMSELESYLDGRRPGYQRVNRILHRDGQYRWHLERGVGTRDQDGRILRVLGTNMDLTEQMRLEEELRLARDQAEAANRAKSEFLTNMSHEMRTPLTAILGFAGTLEESEQTPQARVKALSAVIENGRHLQTLVDDLLDLSKIEADRLEIQCIPLDLPTLVDACANIARTQAQAKGLIMSVQYLTPLPRTIVSDPARLRQILLNLLGNAVKFTERGGIWFIVSCDLEEEILVITVFDTGIGLTQEQRGRLFQPFTQADTSVTRRYGGTGLGLYISHQLAQSLGGDLWLESCAGVGSVFVVTVSTGPVDPAQVVDDPGSLGTTLLRPGETLTVPRVSGRILLAEDNPYNQQLVTHHLAKTGAEIVVVSDGSQAVERALEEEFDLVLMDMQMPVMGGLEATQILRMSLYPVPIVALTAHSMESHRRDAEEAGCNDFLTKPVDWHNLYQVVASYLPPASGDAPLALTSAGSAIPEELSQRFRSSLPETLAQLQDFLAQGDLDGVRGLAHQIKGVAGGLGFPEVGTAAKDAEKAAAAGDRALTIAAIDNMSRLVAALNQPST